MQIENSFGIHIRDLFGEGSCWGHVIDFDATLGHPETIRRDLACILLLSFYLVEPLLCTFLFYETIYEMERIKIRREKTSSKQVLLFVFLFSYS